MTRPLYLLIVLIINLCNHIHTQEAFTAGMFVRKAQEAIDDVISRGKVPVVVGGTSMYTQWLVKGTPDAPKYVCTTLIYVE